MAKTETQIERDFYMIAKTHLGSVIRGTVYRRGQRPDNAKTEDCIAKFLGGVDEQIQTGTVVLNIYVPYIPYEDGRRGEDLNRIGELEEMANEFVTHIESTDYDISKDGTPRTYQEDDIEQSIIALRLKFQRLNQE